MPTSFCCLQMQCLLVAQIDTMDSSSCLITPPEVKYDLHSSVSSHMLKVYPPSCSLLMHITSLQFSVKWKRSGGKELWFYGMHSYYLVSTVFVFIFIFIFHLFSCYSTSFLSLLKMFPGQDPTTTN